MPKLIQFSHSTRYVFSVIAIISMFGLAIAPMTRAEAPNPGDLANANQTVIVDGLTQEERAAKIDAFFGRWDLPLTGYGMDFVKAADAYGVDWRLVASIAFNESTGGKFMIKGTYNPFGWGHGKIKFKSFQDSIEKVTKHLSGQHPATSQYYAGKTLEQVLDAYNPPSVRHDYKKLVKGTMNKISATAVPVTLAVAK
jgi:hypothetical protein